VWFFPALRPGRPACRRQAGEEAKKLFPQFQLANELLVFDRILTFKIVQQSTAFAYQDQETATGVEILFMEFKMIRQKIYPLGQQRNLHLCRTGVLAMGFKIVDDLLLLLVD
jgi:hypothetical protein